MHVGDLDGTKNLLGKTGRWKASVVVTVHDASENPLANATITGVWSGAMTGTATGVTGIDGTIKFNTGKMLGGTSVTFSVSDTVHETHGYSAIENHDPDGDSNGTEITIVN
jgi:serine protease AprX